MTGYELLKMCVCYDFGCTKSAAKAVLVALASFYNEERDGSWPGQKDLSVRSACERKTVMSAIQWLEEHQIIYVERVVGKGNFYRFNVDLLSKGSPENGTTTNFGTSPENGTTPIPKTGQHPSRKRDSTSPENGTQIKKKKEIKKEEKTSEPFLMISSSDLSTMTDEELVSFMDSSTGENLFSAREEYTKRVTARNKSCMRSDFEQPDRPQYEMLGMH